MTALWAARRGLAESELLEVLGTGDSPLPRAVWSPLFLTAEQSLTVRSGLIGFFHDYLREAVRRRYVPNERAEQESHLWLADYFESHDLGRRRLDELPWQLAWARAWQRVFDLLTELPFFQAAWTADQYEVKGYWARIEANCSLRMVDGYRPVLDSPDQYKEFVWQLGVLLADSGHPREAYYLREHLVRYYRQTGDQTWLQRTLGARRISSMRVATSTGRWPYTRKRSGSAGSWETRTDFQSRWAIKR